MGCDCGTTGFGGGGGVGGNDKVKVDAADTTENFLFPKLAAGAGIALAILNPGANESIQVTATGGVSATSDRSNKHMAASATAADGDLACATAVAQNPAPSTTNGGYIQVIVDGLGQFVGDGTKVAVDCYFSGDGGVTARALKSVVAGDLLYWNRTIALFDLAVTDVIDFIYPTIV